MYPVTRRRWTGVVALLGTASLLMTPAAAGAAVPSASTAPTSINLTAAKKATEYQKVDRVKTPKPSWFGCDVFSPGAQCATVKLPLDYDKPKGKKTEVAVLRLKATDTKRKKLGTLFLNPGGPGGSGVEIAAAAPYFMSPAVRARFDIVGFDPRGTNFSSTVKCWKNLGAQAKDLKGYNDVPFPVTTKEKKRYFASSEAFGRACSTQGKPLSASMSTAEVARDMDVLRRMVGDKQLTYLGFSYGTYLGNMYANMFPKRVRAVAIDGVLDPEAWAGRKWTRSTPQTQRIKSGEGASKALNEILNRCKKAGPKYCLLASEGDPTKIYRKVMTSLKKKPLVVRDEDTGEVYFTLGYADLAGFLLDDMYLPEAAEFVDMDLFNVNSLLADRGAKGSALAKRQDKARTVLANRVTQAADAARADSGAKQRQARATGWAFPYDNSPEAFQSVLCTDGLNPSRAKNWPKYANYAQITAPEFGPLWTWASAPCATSTWTARDEDSYSGSFNHGTANPVLVVGNYWDPATNYRGAVKAASLLPKSRLLSSDNWGHTAYGTSACATKAVDTYLLKKKLPPRGKTCKGDIQPFKVSLEDQWQESMQRKAPKPSLPPVVPPIPGAVPRS